MKKPALHAVILAAGEGRRLDSHDLPKPLVKIGSKPMIVHVIEKLQDAGIRTIFLIVGDRGEEIKRELTNNPSVRASLSFIQQPENTGCSMLAVLLSLKDELKGPFILTVSDLIAGNNPYSALKDAGDAGETNDIFTLVGSDKDAAAYSGAQSKVLVKDGSVKMVGKDIKKHDGLELGAYYFKEGALTSLEQENATEKFTNFFEDTLNALVRKGMLKHVSFEGGEWFDVNTPAIYIRANMFLRNRASVEAFAGAGASKKDNPQVHSNFYRARTMNTDIIIERGIFEKVHALRFVLKNNSSSPHHIITDSVVDKLYGHKLLEQLKKSGHEARKLVFPAGEASKNIKEFTRLADEIFSHGLDKGSAIISLGGGVVNNMAGVLASTLYRGITLMHIPTSLMAQVDAAIDFKQAINSTAGKNLLGSYYPASHIIIDPELLKTLDSRHIRNGLGETIKHALTQDSSFFKELLSEREHMESTDFLENIIRKTVELKVPLLNGDTGDDYNEMIPQYGHSVGHAVEHLSGYDLLHGEAVMIGACVSAETARILGFADEATLDAHYEIARAYDLPAVIPENISAEDVCDTIRYDKHYLGEVPHMALPKAIGEMWNDKGVYSVPVDYEILIRAIANNKLRKQ